MGTQEIYDQSFFEEQIDGSALSAKAVVPVIMSLRSGAKSVVDIGCGTGTWLREYAAQGMNEILGIDGSDPPDDLRQIDRTLMIKHDLSKPLQIHRHFDIAQSLEVAEHLDPSLAHFLVDTLTELSDFIVFGAAIPGQGGVNHVNEQWQSFWIEKFERRGYVALDALRPRIWNSSDVCWWYAQNTFIFINERNLELLADVRKRVAGPMLPIDVVHPRCGSRSRTVRLLMDRQMQCGRGDLLQYLPERFSNNLRTRILMHAPSIRDVLVQIPGDFHAILDWARLRRRQSIIRRDRLPPEAKATDLLPRRFRSIHYLDQLISQKTPWLAATHPHPTKIPM